MKLLHIGLCVQPPPFNGFQTAFIDVLGKENYWEIATGDPKLNENAKLLFDLHHPDIVFMQIQAPNIIRPETVRYFHEHGTKAINWTGDVRHTTPQWMVDIAQWCTSSFSNMVDVNHIRNLGQKAEYLEIGYDPLIYNPVGEVKEVAEIVFMGNNYNQFPLSDYRRRMVGSLQKHFGKRFAVFGNGWANANGDNNSSQHEQASIYRGAKIAINCSQFDYNRYSSDRLLRIMGSGCFCLSHHFNGIENDYEVGTQLDTFKTSQEMIEKVSYYLGNEAKRNSMRLTGEHLVNNRNTFTHQVKNIIKL